MVDADEIFISDGAKSDTGNIGDILAADSGGGPDAQGIPEPTDAGAASYICQ